MTLVGGLSDLAERLAEEFNAVRSEIPSGGGGGLTFLATDYGYVASATTNNTTALQAASDAAYAAGGGIVELPVGIGGLDGQVTFLSGVSLRGQGKNASTIRARTTTGAAAQLYFYDAVSSGQRRGETCGFTVDGNGIAQNMLRVKRGANVSFRDGRSMNSKINVQLDGLQNSSFDQWDCLNTGSFTDIQIKVDEGAQHIVWSNSTIKDANLAGVYVTQSIAPGTGQAKQPEHITFMDCVTERAASGIAALVDAGTHVRFVRGALNGPGAVPVMIRRRKKIGLSESCTVNVTIDSVPCTAGNYDVDALCMTTTGEPVYSHDGVTATAEWVSALTPIGDYPVAKLALLGQVRQNVDIAVVLADAGVVVNGTWLDAQGDLPLVVDGSGVVQKQHPIYDFGAYPVYFSGLGTGSTVTGVNPAAVEHRSELLSVSIATDTAPASDITAIPQKRKITGGSKVAIFSTSPDNRPKLTSAGTYAKGSLPGTERFFLPGDRLTMDSIAPTGKAFTITALMRYVV